MYIHTPGCGRANAGVHRYACAEAAVGQSVRGGGSGYKKSDFFNEVSLVRNQREAQDSAQKERWRQTLLSQDRQDRHVVGKLPPSLRGVFRLEAVMLLLNVINSCSNVKQI